MIRLGLALLLCICSPALGQTVRVTSGEHDGFTRLVFDFGRTVDWQVGRNLDGYELNLAQYAPSYDLQDAFALIGKSRLAAIWVAPDTGQLHIGLACACYAIPFEFRPGIIVIDLKDGAPPAGSSFEMSLDGTPKAPISAQAQSRPKRRPGYISEPDPVGVSENLQYSWIDNAYTAIRDPQSAPADLHTAKSRPDILLPDPNLQPLRDTLVHQMARGATQGIVEMADTHALQTNLPETNYPPAQIRIRNAPTSVNDLSHSVQGELGAKGTICLPADVLEIADWGDESLPLIDQIATARSGLIGEFDKPEPDRVIQAIRFQLFLGFGAEARQTLSAFDLTHPDTEVWRALSYLLDDEPDPKLYFKDQAACASPAALWSLLSDVNLVKGDPIDSGAVRLAFAALPLHLRRQIGPALSERFLALGDDETARALRDAVIRAPGDPGNAVSLMEAEIDLYAGAANTAELKAESVISDAGPNQLEGLIALTQARVAQHLPISGDVALALQAHQAENAGTALEPQLAEALILADAASGNFTDAFTGLEEYPNRQEDVWSMLATLGDDTAFLTFAVLDPDFVIPNLQNTTKASIARRLTALGLPAPAQHWLFGVADADPMLVTETALKNRDGRGALTAMNGLDGDIADGLKLQAYSLLGENRLQAQMLTAAGDMDAAAAAQARAGDWEQLAETGGTVWKTLAAHLPETPPPILKEGDLPYGPLAHGHNLAIGSAETRDAISILLAAVPPPALAQKIANETPSQIPTN